MQHWLEVFLEQVKQTTWLEWVAVIMGVTEVLLARVNNIWLYPTGIVGTLCGTFVLLSVGLYAESVLNAYYLIMSVYGWIYWIRKRNEPPVKISWNTKSEWVITALITFGGWLILWFLLTRLTKSNVPILDAFVSAAAWAGMWLLARRKIENWLMLNISNLVAVPLLFYKQLPMFALLTVFLFVVAIFGHIRWVRIWRNEQGVEQANAAI